MIDCDKLVDVFYEVGSDISVVLFLLLLFVFLVDFNLCFILSLESDVLFIFVVQVDDIYKIVFVVVFRMFSVGIEVFVNMMGDILFMLLLRSFIMLYM